MENSLASWLEAIFILAITGFGLIGNTLTFIMLTRKPPRPRWIAPIMRYRASRPQPPSSPLDNPFTESDTQSSPSQRPSTKQGHSSSAFNTSSSPSRNASPPAQLKASSSDKHHSPASQPSSSTPKDTTYLPPLTTRFLLKALAIVDSLILLWPCFIRWTVRLSSGSSIFDRSDAFCKIGTFFNYFLLQLSPWLLVLVTIDRVYNIAFPTFSLKTPLTQTHVKRLFILTMLILALLNSYMLFGLNLRLEKEINNTTYENATNASSSQSDWECYPKDSFKYFVISVWSWIDFAVAFGLPFVFIVLGNVLVLRQMRSSEKFRSRNALGGNMAFPGAAENWAKVSALLGVTFIVLLMPYVVYQIGGSYWFKSQPGKEIEQTFNTLIVLFRLLLYTNSAINFVLYMLLGSPKLRQQFVRPLHDCKKIICKCFSRDE